jgi:hypothetical protein
MTEMKRICKHTSSVGRSAITPIKQEQVRSIITKNAFKAKCVINKYKEEEWLSKEAYFIDCTAGDMDPEKDTSPNIFFEVLNETNGLNSKLFLFEKDPKTYALLNKNLTDRFCKPTISNGRNTRVEVNSMCYDFNKVINDKKEIPVEFILRKGVKKLKCRYGLIYYDPNSYNPDDHEAIYAFLEKNPYMDILMNINISWMNFARSNNRLEKYTENLINVSEKIDKKYIWIRDNIEIDKIKKKGHRFVLLFGTNMTGYTFNENHFYKLESTKGCELLENYAFTKKEKRTKRTKINTCV